MDDGCILDKEIKEKRKEASNVVMFWSMQKMKLQQRQDCFDRKQGRGETRGSASWKGRNTREAEKTDQKEIWKRKKTDSFLPAI